jgi:hypothetical protein
MFRDRDRGASEESALRRIYVTALRERKRLTPGSAGARAMDQIIGIARGAL